ncbi:MAG: hypothetical protein ACYDCJ_12485 [Gammaproteobacteria bacterium]
MDKDLEPLEIIVEDTGAGVGLNFSRPMHLERAVSEKGCTHLAFFGAHLRILPEKTPTLVMHGTAANAGFHPLSKPCALCRPPIVVTDEMAERALKAFHEPATTRVSVKGGVPFSVDAFTAAMRAALEAALNG